MIFWWNIECSNKFDYNAILYKAAIKNLINYTKEKVIL